MSESLFRTRLQVSLGNLAPLKVRFDSCPLFYTDWLSFLTYYTTSRRGHSSSRPGRVLLLDYSTLFWSKRDQQYDYRGKARWFVWNRCFPFLKRPVVVLWPFLRPYPSFRLCCSRTAARLHSRIAPGSQNELNLWPAVEKSWRGTCSRSRNLPSSVWGMRYSSLSRRFSFSAVKCSWSVSSARRNIL